MAKVLGLEEPIAAGAVICGAYFGDKMTPLSETTILVPELVGRGLTTGQHIKNMIWTAGPALGISLVLFLLLGLNAEPEGAVGTEAAQDALGTAFNISAVNLLPLALLVLFAILKYPPFLAILGSALFAGILAPFTQSAAVKAFVDDPGSGRSPPPSRPTSPPWPPASSAPRAWPRSTTCSRGAGWPAC